MSEPFKFNNKKVVLLLKSPVLGGAERQALGLAKALIIQCNCVVEIVATHSSIATKEFIDFASLCGVNKIHFFGLPSLAVSKKISIANFKKMLRAFLFFNKIKKGIKCLKPDVLIPYLNAPSKIAVLIYKLVGAKVTFWHQLGLDSYYFDSLELRAVRNTPFFIANAESGLDVFKNKYNVNTDKLFVLPQFISIEKQELDAPKIKQKLGIDNEALVIVMIAHYRKEKYQELLLEAFLNIETDRKTHLIFLGNKDNDNYSLEKYNKLKALSKQKSTNKEITVLSGINVHEILNIADIGVLVSKIEGTPNVIMEYMLYGLPVISSNHLGCIELLKQSSFLINNAVGELVASLKVLIEDDKLRKTEGNNNKEIIKQYSSKNYIKSLEKIINKFF